MDGPQPFRDPASLRAWFAKNAAKESELWILFYKVHTGRPTVTYAQALEEALCFGWIDGKVRRVDDESYMQRYTPRRPESVWSAVNLRKAEALVAMGRMTSAGLAAFERRDRSAEDRDRYENRPKDLPPDALRRMKMNPRAWEFWMQQPASYRKDATWFVLSAKREETRARRVAAVISYSAQGRRMTEDLGPATVKPPRRPRKKSSRGAVGRKGRSG